jgi:hypothetical protein
MGRFTLRVTWATLRTLALRVTALLLVLAAGASILAAVAERQRHERAQQDVESNDATHFHVDLASRNYGDFLPARP